jgi:hypothetical protein
MFFIVQWLLLVRRRGQREAAGGNISSQRHSRLRPAAATVGRVPSRVLQLLPPVEKVPRGAKKDVPRGLDGHHDSGDDRSTVFVLRRTLPHSVRLVLLLSHLGLHNFGAARGRVEVLLVGRQRRRRLVETGIAAFQTFYAVGVVVAIVRQAHPDPLRRQRRSRYLPRRVGSVRRRQRR